MSATPSYPSDARWAEFLGNVEILRTAASLGITVDRLLGVIQRGLAVDQAACVHCLSRGLPADHDSSVCPSQRIADRLQYGGSFILDAAAAPEALWGDGFDVLAAVGEPTMIAGPQGTGKTTLAQQLVLGLIGLPEYDTLLGYPIKPAEGLQRRVLYLAMDRPRQIARSFRRMVGEAMRGELDGQLRIWQGPPWADFARAPGMLWETADLASADVVVVDSLKDAVIGLNDDEVAAGWNRARQRCVAGGIDVIELHHVRKLPTGSKADKPTIDSLYGSTWLTAGCGSVLLLAGAPGDPIVRMYHLKQPANEVGPLQLIHDAESGRTTVRHAVDLVMVAGTRKGGLTALDAARFLFEVDKPTPAQKEKARRRLERLTTSGLLVCREGDAGTKTPAVWEVPTI